MRRAMLGFVIFCGLSTIPRPAPATISEQRARLPPAAECGEDPVTGIWKSHQWDPRYRDWTIFTLRIERVGTSGPDHNLLTGTITNHQWDATGRDEEPPPCSPGRNEWIVSMSARGHVDAELNIFFGGQGQWSLDRIICNGGPGGYNLDNFTGRIEVERNEFQSVNNDGGRAVDSPTVFRRIRCLSNATQAPNVQPRPPDFYPNHPTAGCSLL